MINVIFGMIGKAGGSGGQAASAWESFRKSWHLRVSLLEAGRRQVYTGNSVIWRRKSICQHSISDDRAKCHSRKTSKFQGGKRERL